MENYPYSPRLVINNFSLPPLAFVLDLVPKSMVLGPSAQRARIEMVRLRTSGLRDDKLEAKCDVMGFFSP